MRHNPFAPNATLVAEIEAALASAPFSVSHVGLRIEVDRRFMVGGYLPESRVWDNGDLTDLLLAGTSAVALALDADAAAITAALEALGCYFGDHLVLVGGSGGEAGEDDGEIIVADAICLGAW